MEKSVRYLVVSCVSEYINSAEDIYVLGLFKSRECANKAIMEDIKEDFVGHEYEDVLDIMREDDNNRFDDFLREYKSVPGADNVEALWDQVEHLFKPATRSGFFKGWFGRSYQISKVKV